MESVEPSEISLHGASDSRLTLVAMIFNSNDVECPCQRHSLLYLYAQLGLALKLIMGKLDQAFELQESRHERFRRFTKHRPGVRSRPLEVLRLASQSFRRN